MTNTTELRKRFRDKMHEAHWPESAGLYRTLDVNSVEDWVVSEIEQAERAKMEHTAERIAHDAEMSNYHQFAKHIRSKFL